MGNYSFKSMLKKYVSSSAVLVVFSLLALVYPSLHANVAKRGDKGE